MFYELIYYISDISLFCKYYIGPTYPQLYAAGELIGGLDIVKELLTNGQPLIESLGVDKIQNAMLPTETTIFNSITSTSNTSLTDKDKKEQLNKRLEALINQASVMLFMKGSPSQPKCGFSRTIAEILNEQEIQFGSFDILTDEDVRSGLKIFSDWPTYPQLYCKGISFLNLLY